ncbi:unnamed protein product [Adineta steineri]|uniref:Uncharacterized protein n=1 Tax=Adineta steineri TaxID=433720 RepID=A0A814R1S5_9BILA|nr:unnamed protein product [Adineta steineri]CAF1125767.1 unnamed protein product [Adineta steineri]
MNFFNEEEELNEKSECLFKNKICLIILFICIGIFMILLLFDKSYRFNFSISSKQILFNNQTNIKNDIHAWRERLCIFSKICYNIDANYFYYFRSNEKPIYYDSSKDMIYGFGKPNGIFNLLSLSTGGSIPWAPLTVSGSMEGAFLNHISHVKKHYYQIYKPKDYKFDYPASTNTREDSSIVINMTCLKLLIDNALQDIEPSHYFLF